MALPDRFELLCWNIHKNPSAVSALSQLAPNADLVLLQESVPALDVPPGQGTLVVALRRGRDQRPAGVQTISRTAPSSSIPLLSDSLEPLVHTPKSALVTTLPFARGGELLVANVHGVNFRPAAALAGQLDELEPLLSKHHGPMIVAGDFNTWSRRRRSALAEFSGGHGLTTVFTGPSAPRLDAVLYRGLHPESMRVVQNSLSDHAALRVWFSL